MISCQIVPIMPIMPSNLKYGYMLLSRVSIVSMVSYMLLNMLNMVSMISYGGHAEWWPC